MTSENFNIACRDLCDTVKQLQSDYESIVTLKKFRQDHLISTESLESALAITQSALSQMSIAVKCLHLAANEGSKALLLEEEF